MKSEGKTVKKFILVDNQCNTNDHKHLEAGRYHLSKDGSSMNESVATLMKSGVNSPILAVLNYPGVIDDGLKMFLLNVWNLENEDYSIVKEIALPTITAEHKLAFAIKAVAAIYDFPHYMKWADEWIDGRDRSMASLTVITNIVEEEIKELENAQKISYDMGLDLDEKDGEKKAQFERAKIVFHAAAVVLNSQEDKALDMDIVQVFNGIEEFIDPENINVMSDEVLKVA